jgi:hypothetical protein
MNGEPWWNDIGRGKQKNLEKNHYSLMSIAERKRKEKFFTA